MNFIFVYGPAPEKINAVPDVAVVAAKAVGGDSLSILVRAIVSVALLSSVSSMIVAGPRVYAKMASDGVFPNLLGARLHNDIKIPATAVWLQVILASIVVCFSSLKSLLDYLGFTLSVSAATTVACILWSRRQKDTVSHRLVYSAIAIVYVAATMGLAALSAINRPQQLIGFGFTVVSGVALFFLFRQMGTRSASGDR